MSYKLIFKPNTPHGWEFLLISVKDDLTGTGSRLCGWGTWGSGGEGGGKGGGQGR